MSGQQVRVGEELKNFLNTNQYSRKSILRYEKIFGKTFVSTGGVNTTNDLCQKMDLKEGQRILDVGSGIGGSAFFLAEKYNVLVDGVDLSSNMVDIALEYLVTMSEKVQKNVNFKVEDATTMNYPENFYDLVYSRDTILHIQDKKSLFENFFKSLKPGGKVVITDYCRDDLKTSNRDSYSQEFDDYVKDRGYHLLTVEEYGKVLMSAGFSHVTATDMTDEFIDILRKELDGFQKIKDEVVKEYSEEDFDHICQGWEEKVVRCNQGDQAWGYFVAIKT